MSYSFESPKVYDKLLLPKDSKYRQSIVISNPLGYLFALAIGSVVGMFGLALLKKPLK